MTAADTAVVDAVEHDLLRMEVIEAGLARAIDAARQADDHADTSRDALHARLATLATELQHFTEVIAQGGAALPTVIAAITSREAEKADLEAEVARRTALSAAPALDDAAVRSAMASVLMDWQTALHENVPQSQQALRKLLAGRLASPRTRTPTAATPSLLRGGSTRWSQAACPGYLLRWCPRRDSNPCCQIENLES